MRGRRSRSAAIEGPGMRTYLAVRGGFDAPLYLGSRSTFSLGGFGGHATGALKAGDTLHIGHDAETRPPLALLRTIFRSSTDRWEIGVLYGPHGAPEFFTEEDIETLFTAEYEVHFQQRAHRRAADRPAARNGRAPMAARRACIPPTFTTMPMPSARIDFTGDMPIILGPDGPSLGGFVCPAVVARERAVEARPASSPATSFASAR